jgi:hypothetical protein
MNQLYGQYDLGVEIGKGSHISLSSDDDYSSDLKVREVFAELVQQSRLKAVTRKYSIVNVHYLLVEERGKTANRKYWVDLGYLSDKPKRRLIIEWKWLLTAAVSALVTVATYKSIPLLDFANKTLILAGVLVVTALLTLSSLYVFFDKSRYRQVYYSRTGNVPFVELMPGRPDRKRYRQFMNILQEHLLLVRRKEPDRGKSLARELREHRRLYDAGVISDRQYAGAKAIILRSYS